MRYDITGLQHVFSTRSCQLTNLTNLRLTDSSGGPQRVGQLIYRLSVEVSAGIHGESPADELATTLADELGDIGK